MKEIILSDGKVLNMREPKVRDYKAAQAGAETTEEVDENMIRNLTGTTEEEFSDFSLADYFKLRQTLQDFLDAPKGKSAQIKPPKTSTKKSQ